VGDNPVCWDGILACDPRDHPDLSFQVVRIIFYLREAINDNNRIM